LIRGQYCFRRMAAEAKQGMVRSDVLQLADRIGYSHHYVQPKDLIEGKMPLPEEVSDEFTFNNFMLSSVVFITYDENGKVKDIVADQ